MTSVGFDGAFLVIVIVSDARLVLRVTEELLRSVEEGIRVPCVTLSLTGVFNSGCFLVRLCFEFERGTEVFLVIRVS